MTFNFQKDKLIILLLLTDLMFILMHILFMYTDVITNFIFALWRDRGPAEFFQYIKYIWVLVLFLVIFFKRRNLLFFVYSLLFFYFLIDDFFEGHETVGGFLAEYFSLPALFFGLRPQDLGEFIVYVVVGSIFFSLITIFHLRSDLYARTISKYMVILIVLLAFFGIGIDMVGMAFEDEWVGAFFNMIEDGGELIVMSFITWFVYRLNPWTDEIPIFKQKPIKETTVASEQLSARTAKH
jgi:hypothetical protein